MINVYHYKQGGGLTENRDPAAFLPAMEGEILWVDLFKPDREELRVLEKDFGFHPLAIEDAVKRMQRSKLDDYGDYLFIVVHAVGETDLLKGLNMAELAIFYGRNYIVTVHWEQVRALDEVADRIRKNGALLERGIDYLLYLVLDTVVDDYFPLLDVIDDAFSETENKLLTLPEPDSLFTLFLLRRRLVGLRKILSPFREMFNILLRFEGTYFKNENRLFYLDVYDHLMRIFDFVETYRDLIGGGLEMYLTVMSNRTNEVMKVLTVISTIMLPLTLISSIYGMNFRYMPELTWRYGYFAVLGFMALLAIGMVAYFRRKKWF
ncbi:MAG: magnesium/cobalt transporter CorA [Bacillota bacterium]